MQAATSSKPAAATTQKLTRALLVEDRHLPRAQEDL